MKNPAIQFSLLLVLGVAVQVSVVPGGRGSWHQGRLDGNWMGNRGLIKH